jgi:hypothetical protein
MQRTIVRRTIVRRIAVQRTAVAFLILLTTAFGAQAAGAKHPVRTPQASSGAVTYNRDSPNPKLGWHWDNNGMRVCSNDCDNPEIPGSGYTCYNVQAFGMPMRECDWHS